MPQDGILQISQSINTYWTLHNNPTLNRFVQFFNIHNPLYPRPLIVNYENNTHENIYMSVYGNNYAYSTYIAEMRMKNNLYTNVTCLEGAAYIRIANKLFIENDIYENSLNRGHGSHLLYEINEITVTNLTMRNFNATGSSAQYYLYIYLNPGGSAYINSLSFVDSYIGFQAGVYIEESVNHFVIQN